MVTERTSNRPIRAVRGQCPAAHRPFPRVRFVLACLLLCAAGAEAKTWTIPRQGEPDTEWFRITLSTGCSVGQTGQFQLFLDTDWDEQTGYASGYDVLVRGVEFLDEHHVYLRSAQPGDGPGGWGAALCHVLVVVIDANNLALGIPRTEAGLSDSGYRFRFETYQDGVLVEGIDGTQTGVWTGCVTDADCVLLSNNACDWNHCTIGESSGTCDAPISAVYGDCSGQIPGTEPDGVVGLADLLCALEAFGHGNFDNCPNADLYGGGSCPHTDGVVNANDVIMILDALGAAHAPARAPVIGFGCVCPENPPC